ncbi:MAG: Eco57I restriction-modification methylase domain-containing protein [Pseudolabrys sp.]|nr:Eco57I restriction-modification methylase domain-containing protein [Pseudolabrys sp.]
MPSSLAKSIDTTRLDASGKLDPDRRVALGQFMTPSEIAHFMASLFQRWPDKVRMLDPGAGIGSLSEAFAASFLKKARVGSQLEISAYEIEPILAGHLREHLFAIESVAGKHGGFIRTELHQRDFIEEATFASQFPGARYTHVILNPPYKKISNSSEYRTLLRHIGVETVNLYAAFLALSVALTENEGEIVAIIPRSFCNGMYFRQFRAWLLERVAISHIHVFDSRNKAFSDDSVLQENIIIRLEKGVTQGHVIISTSNDASFSDYKERSVPFSEIVHPADHEQYIHIPTHAVAGGGSLFACSLADLGLQVSTGPVVDFRVKAHTRANPTDGSVPLLYAHHFAKGVFNWPREHKKPNAILVNDETRKWLMPRGWYAVTKRFSSKEERRRLVSFVLDPTKLNADFYGFENHLNIIHSGKQGIDPDMARGISVFLNSTIVDLHFRNFSGHTQVNATDLRTMRYPSKEVLKALGKWSGVRETSDQTDIDLKIEEFHDY